MNKLRLLTLATHLRTNVPGGSRFYMGTWAGKSSNPFRIDDKLDHPSCGTSGCAMGWATTIPDFKAMGLFLLGKHYQGAHTADLVYQEPTDDKIRYYGFDAVNVFMDLEPNDSDYLFDANQYGDNVTPEDVADRIEAFVASDGEHDE